MKQILIAMMLMGMPASAMDRLQALTFEEKQLKRDRLSRTIARNLDEYFLKNRGVSGEKCYEGIHGLMIQFVVGEHTNELRECVRSAVDDLEQYNIINEDIWNPENALVRFSLSQAYIALKSGNRIWCYRTDTGKQIFDYNVGLSGQNIKDFSFINKSHMLKIVVANSEGSAQSIYFDIDFGKQINEPHNLGELSDDQDRDPKVMAAAEQLAKEALEIVDTPKEPIKSAQMNISSINTNNGSEDSDDEDDMGILALAPDYCVYHNGDDDVILLNLKDYVAIKQFFLQPPTLELASIMHTIFHKKIKIKDLAQSDYDLFQKHVPAVLQKVIDTQIKKVANTGTIKT